MKKSIFRNDKVILLKEYNVLKQVGETFEVAGVTDTVIVIRELKTKIAVGAIAIEDFDEYFTKVESVGSKSTFTPWTKLVDPLGDTVAFYRTNQKRTQVKLPVRINHEVVILKAEASCNKGDEFNLYFGIQLALCRALDKYSKICIENNNRKNRDLLDIQKENKRTMDNMFKSLQLKNN